MFMIMLVLDEVNHVDDVLTAWTKAGAMGVTALEGFGPHERRAALGLVHARRNVENLGLGVESPNFTLFAAAADERVAEQCLAATESVIGDLAVSQAGIWAVWPLAWVKGLNVSASNCGAR